MKKTVQTLFAFMIFVLGILCTFLALIYKFGKQEQEINQQIQQERLFLSAASDLLSATEEMVIAGRGYYIAKDPQLLQSYQLARIHAITAYDILKSHKSYRDASVEVTEQLQTAFNNRLRISDSITTIAKEKNTARFNLSKVILDGNKYSAQLHASVNKLTRKGIGKIEKLEQKSSATPQIQQGLFVATVIMLVLAMITGYLYLVRNSKQRIKAQEYLSAYRQSNHFLNSLTEAIIVQDKTGHLIECNAAAEKILGVSAGQLLEQSLNNSRLKTIRENGADFPREEHPSMQVVATGKSIENVVMGIYKPSGELVWIEVSAHPVKAIKDGEIVSIVSRFTDITEKKSKDDLIKRTQILMESSMNAIKEGFHMIDHTYKAVLVNNASKTILSETVGMAPEVGDHVLDFIPGERKEVAKNILAKVFAGESMEYEVLYNRLQPVWLSYSITPVKDHYNNIQFACVLFKNITERKLKEEKIKEDEERLRMALEKTGDNAWEHNFKTDVTWFSSANNSLLGFTSEELNHHENRDYWWEQTHPDDKYLLQQNDFEYRAGLRSSHSLEYRIFHKDGSLKWVLDRGVVIEWDSEGKPLRIVGTHTDISKEKQLQQQLLKQEQQKKRDIIEAVIQAQEKEREEIAYELHEEIAQVLSSVKMLLTSIADTASQPTSTIIHQSIESLAGVVDEIRLISQNINSSTLQLIGVVNAMEDVISRAATISSVKFHLNTTNYIEEEPVDFSIKLTLLRLLQAMVKNIVRHSNATSAHIELYTQDKYIHLSVKDDGQGFQLSDALKGLGIQTMINRTEQYGGHINIESTPGNGCLIHITLPFLHASEL